MTSLKFTPLQDILYFVRNQEQTWDLAQTAVQLPDNQRPTHRNWVNEGSGGGEVTLNKRRRDDFLFIYIDLKAVVDFYWDFCGGIAPIYITNFLIWSLIQ